MVAKQQMAGKAGKATSKRTASTDSKKSKSEVKPTVKVEPSESHHNGVLSPKRTVRNISREFSAQELVAGNLSMMKDDDCFSYLTELPSEQLELLMNCDIRYSLPKQGQPGLAKPSPSKARQNKDSVKSEAGQKRRGKSSSPELPSGPAALVKVNPVGTFRSSSFKLPPIPVEQPELVDNRLQV